MKKLLLLLIMCAFFFIACKKEAENLPIPITFSKISINNNGAFVNSEAESFFPWGFNYTNPEGVGLIEDNWQNNTVWQIIESDFAEMKDLTANVVRIHLQYHRFMIDAETPNTLALNRLADLVEVAAQNELYLDITGLAAYRAGDAPSFYDTLSDEERWTTQKIFWQNIAAKIGGHPAVFAFNLMNEPVVSVGCDGVSSCDWLPGNSFGGFNFVQNITRNPNRTFAPTMKEWIAEMTTAIRSEDNNTLITVGFLNLGSVKQFATDLDYVSTHIYPKSEMIETAIDFIVNNQSSTPLVIEETSNLHCTIDELEEFLNEIDGQYDGLMGHYFGKTIDEHKNNDIKDALRKNFLRFFKANNPNKSG